MNYLKYFLQNITKVVIVNSLIWKWVILYWVGTNLLFRAYNWNAPFMSTFNIMFYIDNTLILIFCSSNKFNKLYLQLLFA